MDAKELKQYLSCKGITVDEDDLPRILEVSLYWNVLVRRGSTSVAYTTVATEVFYLHRLVTNAPPHLMVDHIDGNGLNNKKTNLRLCNNQQNCMNQKPRGGRKYKGISKLPSGKYRARVTIDGSHFNLGVFKTEQEAAIAYNEWAIKIYGEFARLNVVEER